MYAAFILMCIFRKEKFGIYRMPSKITFNFQNASIVLKNLIDMAEHSLRLQKAIINIISK